jgi:hypothetical protein
MNKQVTVTRKWTMEVGSVLCFPSPSGRGGPTYVRVTEINVADDVVDFIYLHDGSKGYDHGVAGLAMLVDLDPEVHHDDAAEAAFMQQGRIILTET